MDDMRLKFYQPVVTGVPGAGQYIPKSGNDKKESGDSFQSVLQRQLEQSGGVNFSKHAVKRAAEHNLELSDESLARLNEGVRLAGEKHLEDTLILVDRTAFLVNVKNNTVITAVNSADMKGNVFTNIDGTVIM